MFVWKKTFDKLKAAYDDLDKMLTDSINREHKLNDKIKEFEEKETIHKIEINELIKELMMVKK